jgi:plasmid stabilization system protein ParE
VRRAIIIRPEAQAEIVQATDRYQAINPQLRIAFRHELQSVLRRIRANPLQFTPVQEGVHAAFLATYRYRITFQVEDHEIVILACTHDRQDPQVWMKRMP